MKINNLNDLKLELENNQSNIFNAIIDQAKQGDPDWALDLIDELDNSYAPENSFFVPGWHDKLGHLTPNDFNIPTLTRELYALANNS
jgi:hypothetical protein